MQVKSRLVHLFQGREQLPWGSSPEAFDAALTEQTLHRVDRLFGDGCYFGLDVQGWENVPSAPVLLISNHSGGTTVPDAWGLLISWYRHFGTRRAVHILVHEIILATRRTGEYFSRRGALIADPEVALSTLRDHRRDLLIMPGGDFDTWRPYRDRYKVCFGGRKGYARLALEAGVPIVPIAHAGAHETLYVIARGARLASAVGLPKIARARVWPVHLSLPWGLAVGPLPHIPIPAKLRYRIGPAICPAADDTVEGLDARVRAAVQDLLDDLKATEHNPRGGPSSKLDVTAE